MPSGFATGMFATARMGAGNPPTRMDTPSNSVGSGSPVPITVPDTFSPCRNRLASPPGAGKPARNDAPFVRPSAGNWSGLPCCAIFHAHAIARAGGHDALTDPDALTRPVDVPGAIQHHGVGWTAPGTST